MWRAFVVVLTRNFAAFLLKLVKQTLFFSARTKCETRNDHVGFCTAQRTPPTYVLLTIHLASWCFPPILQAVYTESMVAACQKSIPTTRYSWNLKAYSTLRRCKLWRSLRFRSVPHSSSFPTFRVQISKWFESSPIWRLHNGICTWFQTARFMTKGATWSVPAVPAGVKNASRTVPLRFGPHDKSFQCRFGCAARQIPVVQKPETIVLVAYIQRLRSNLGLVSKRFFCKWLKKLHFP